MSASRPDDTRVAYHFKTACEVRLDFEAHLYRMPIRFGGRTLDRVTLLNVAIEVENRRRVISRAPAASRGIVAGSGTATT